MALPRLDEKKLYNYSYDTLPNKFFGHAHAANKKTMS